MTGLKVLTPVAISLLALVVSFSSLYLSWLHPAELQVVAGEHVTIKHQDGGTFVLTLPVNLANAGSRLVTVDRLAMLIQSADSPEGYLLEPLYYLRIIENTSTGPSFAVDSLPVPITISGRENVTKQVGFCSSYDRPTEFKLTRAGTYALTLLAWARGSAKPRAYDRFAIVVSEANVASIAKQDAIKLPQSRWRSWSAHHLTAVEVKILLER
jgi:hypothetical protein